MTEHNNSKFTVEFTSALNKALTVTSYPERIPLHFAVLFNIRSSALEFQYDSKAPDIQSGKISVRLVRRLENCDFCNMFFKLETIKNDKQDFRCKFMGTNRAYNGKIINYMGEKLNMSAVKKDRKDEGASNLLTCTGWKILDYDDDLIFYFVQRRIFNPITKVDVVRTMAIQYSTLRGLDALGKYYNQYKQTVKKAVVVPDYLKDIDFEGKLN